MTAARTTTGYKVRLKLRRRADRFSLFPAAIAVAAGLFASGAVPAHAAPVGYSLEWSDEFNEGVNQAPSSSTWNHETGHGASTCAPYGFGTGELEYMTDDTAHSEIVSDATAASSGIPPSLPSLPYALQIEADDESGTYYSARLNTYGKVMPQYGYLEARIQSPFTVGSWPAWWMLGTTFNAAQVENSIVADTSACGGSPSSGVWPVFQNYYGWPNCGEIDIMENPGESDKSTPTNPLGENNWGTLHFNMGSSYNPTNDSTQYTLPDGDFQEGYHTYALQWSPDQINYFIDGSLYGQHSIMDAPESLAYESSTVGWPFNSPFYFMLDLAVCGDGGFCAPSSSSSTWPQDLKVNYVRVYEQPYNGPHFLPGTVENEDYDVGGEGVSYHTTSTTNASGAYRSDGVNIEQEAPGSGGGYYGYDVIGGAAGQWLKYTIHAQAGAYTINFNVKSPNGGSFHIQDASGNNLTGPINVTAASGWQFVTATATLTSGTQTLALYEDSAGVSFDYMSFVMAREVPYGGIHNIPGTVQNEDYDCGGSNVGYDSYYSSSNSGNTGQCYRNDAVDILNTGLGQGGEGGMYVADTNPNDETNSNVAEVNPNDWFKYTVQVNNPGTYAIAFQAASPGMPSTLHILDESNNPVGTEVPIPQTGSSTTWEVVVITANLTAGVHTYTLSIDSGNPSLDYMSFEYGGSAPYNGLHEVPGIIKSVDYDTSYNDTQNIINGSYGNSGGDYRADSVGISSAYGNEGNAYVGWLYANQELDYTDQVDTTGAYLGTFTVASPVPGGQFHIADEEYHDLTGPILVPQTETTSGSIYWASVCAPMNLRVGTHTLRLIVDTPGFWIQDMQINATGPLASISLSSSAITAGSSTTGTVTLAAPAFNTLADDGLTVVKGEYIRLLAENDVATISGVNVVNNNGPELFIPTGNISGTFTISTAPVIRQTVVPVVAWYSLPGAEVGSARFVIPRSVPLTINVAPPPPPPPPPPYEYCAGHTPDLAICAACCRDEYKNPDESTDESECLYWCVESVPPVSHPYTPSPGPHPVPRRGP